MDSFLTPCAKFEAEISIKRSRFIAACAPVASKDQAKEFLWRRQKAYPEANHHCWAMVAGAPRDEHQQDQSDDGEPRGTAGKPMLVVLRHAEIGQIMVVVSRIFGGTKLGVGGLSRAYSQAVVNLLENLQTKRLHARVAYDVLAPYSLLASLLHYLPTMNCQIQDKRFGTDVELTVLVPEAEEERFVAFIKATGSGSISFSKRDNQAVSYGV
ncbi:MAG: YigZ family protein [Granulosicoccus sp.]